MKHVLRTLIVDDEAWPGCALRTLLQDCPDPAVQVVAEAADAHTALAWLQDGPGCDLALLGHPHARA